MVWIDHSNRETALRVLRKLNNLGNEINDALRHADNNDVGVVYDATFVSTRNQAAIDAGEEMVKILRWFIEDANQLNRPAVTPYTDTEIDALPDAIRGYDDGN